MEKRYLFMKKCKGNVVLNVILILGLCFLILNGLFLMVIGRVDINKLKTKEKDEYYIQERKMEMFLKNKFKEAVTLNQNQYNEETIKKMYATTGDYDITVDSNKKEIRLDKKINLSITECYYYGYEISGNNICFKRKKYYEIK